MPRNTPWNMLLQLRFDDVNAAGHIGNIALTRIFDEARTAFLGYNTNQNSSGATGGILESLPDGITRLVGQQTIEFKRELMFSAKPVRAEVWISHVGRTSFSLSCVIKDETEAAPVVLAQSTIVLVDRSTGQAWEISDNLRELLLDAGGAPLPLRPLRR